jgi:paired amphipathic helix protein Sin3a
MPPVGNFAPPASAGKESKKRPRTDKTIPVTTPTASEVPISAVRGSLPVASGSNKRAKLAHKPGTPDGPLIEPTLTPVMPEPLGPIPPGVANPDDLVFFDRVKKHIGNRTTMNEFIKLINLFVMDLITKEVLVHKASHFIGSNPDLMNWLKNFVKYTGETDEIRNQPEPPTGRVSLSNCRGYGPSYRLLPKRVSSSVLYSVSFPWLFLTQYRSV